MTTKGRKGDLTDQEAFLTQMRKRFAAVYERESENRDEMYDDIKFSYGGEHQWEDKVYRERIADGRPALTINRVKTPIRQVSNDIRLNKPSIKVAPRDDQSDKEVAKIYEGLIRNIEVNSQANVAYQTAVDGSIRCGYGAFEIRNVYNSDDSFEQDLVIKRILNQFSVFIDPGAKEITREDMRWAFVTESITEERFQEKYPNAVVSSYDEGDSQYELWYSEKIRIARYYVKEPVRKTLVQFDDGTVSYKTKEQEEAGVYDEDSPVKVVRERKVNTHKVMCYVVSGAEILEKPYEVPSRYIPIIPVLGEETIVDGELKLSGIVRDAKDPQRLYNYWRTTAAETIALQPKVPWLVTEKMVEGLQSQWNVANKANLPYLLFKWDERAGRPVREPPPQPPAAMWQESAIAADDVKFTTGIFDAGIGNTGPEQSGKAILARQQKSDLGNYIYTDNLTIAITHAGKILVDMIPRIYDTQRIVRVLNPDDTDELVEINKKLPDGTMINDITTGKYDVAVSTGPSYDTKRQEAAQSIMAFMQALPTKADIMADLAAKNMDWAESDAIAKRLRKTIPGDLLEGELDEEEQEQQQARSQAEQQRNQMLEQLEMAELAEKDSKTRLNIAKAKETLSRIDAKELDDLIRVIEATSGAQK